MLNVGRSLETSNTSFQVPRPGTYSLDVAWLFAPPSRPYQRLKLSINDNLVAEVQVDKPCILEFFVFEEGVLDIDLPDASRPVDVGIGPDTRTLSIGIAGFEGLYKFDVFHGVRIAERRVEAALRESGCNRPDLALAVESLGDNCELGMVQRELGADPLGLFRFSTTSPDTLIRALEEGLRDLGSPGSLTLSLLGEQREYMVHDKRYGLLYHTWQFEREVGAEQILAKEYSRLSFLSRKFLEDAAAGEKVFVYRDHGQLSQMHARRLLKALRAFGPNELLIVSDSDAAHAPNTFFAQPHEPAQAWIGYKGPDWWMIADTWIETLIRAKQLKARNLPVQLQSATMPCKGLTRQDFRGSQ